MRLPLFFFNLDANYVKSIASFLSISNRFLVYFLSFVSLVLFVKPKKPEKREKPEQPVMKEVSC